jgi:MFS family permease
MEDIQSIGKKITLVLFAEQGLASAALIAAATLNSIVGAKLAGTASLAGLPSATYLIAGAFSAFGWGYLNDLWGRRGGLVAGLLTGSLGLGIAFVAIARGSFPIFLVGMVFVGIANAAVLLGRFAAAEVNAPLARGRAISNVVVGGTIGSVVGPFVAGPAGQAFKGLAGDELAGAYAIGLMLFAIAALVVFLGLRPDPREVGRQIAQEYPEPAASTVERPGTPSGRSPAEIFREPAAMVALTAMMLGQLVMVLVMVITALHMKDHHHALGDISIVISAHTFGMYAFSVFSGRLVDRWGRGAVIMTGAGTLVLACLAATVSPDVLPLGVALFFLGLGWNFCYVGGSTLLSDQLSPQERARTQGVNDLFVGLASATGSLSSGFVFAHLGYSAMAYVGAVLALVPLLAASAWMRGRARSLGLAS